MFKSTGAANFDKLLEKATSNLLLEVDLYAVMGICDLIRQKDCPPKYAMGAIKKKILHQNPHVAYYGLQVLESVVKNCGSPVHEEVATKEFMESMRDLAKTTTHDNVRDKILELIQAWGHAFRKISTYRAVTDCLNLMKAEGCKFPPLVEAEAMFCADTAPEWQDGGCCNRCRVEFGIMNRKHHCRACGQIFCGKCSSKQATLPKFGIEKEVRVCDSCFDKYGSKDNDSIDDPVDMLLRGGGGRGQTHNSSKSSPPPQHSQSEQQPRGKTDEELQEEEQLQLALAISQSEAEAKEREKQRNPSSVVYNTSNSNSTPVHASNDREASEKSPVEKPALKKSPETKAIFEQEDPELARYLDRNYWEQRHGQVKEQIPKDDLVRMQKTPSPFQPSAPIKENKNKMEQVEEIDTFVHSLRGQIEMFVNRMRSNSSRGRHISNDTSVQSLFMNVTALHSQLLNYIKIQDDWRGYYEGLQEKLNQVQDARDALDSLRKEHQDRQKQIAEEAERQRQIQLAIKLHDMRQKKHQYLQYQRDIALRKVQDEEKSMQLRIDQQRMGTYGGYPPGPPISQGYGPIGVPGQMVISQDPQQMLQHYMQMQQPHYLPHGQQLPANMPPMQQPTGMQSMPTNMAHYPQPPTTNSYFGQIGIQGQTPGPGQQPPPSQYTQPGQFQIPDGHLHHPQDQFQAGAQIHQAGPQQQSIPPMSQPIGTLPPNQQSPVGMPSQQNPVTTNQQGAGHIPLHMGHPPVTQQHQQFYSPPPIPQGGVQPLPQQPQQQMLGPSSFNSTGPVPDVSGNQVQPHPHNEPTVAELISFD